MLSKLDEYRDFRELDWQPVGSDNRQHWRTRSTSSKSASDVLKTLTDQLQAAQNAR